MTSMPGSMSSLLWFVAVIALIPVALWLLKRTPMGGMSSRPGTPRTVAVLPISAQQKLLTVEVGQGEERIWLVLGVSPQGIRTLHTMSAQAEEAPASPPAPPSAAFAQLLGRLKNGKSGGPHGA